MKDTLQVGIRGSKRFRVTDDMAPPHLPMKVLSTPSMVGLIEGTCLQAAQEHLHDGETTVGVHVCFSHSASVPSGDDIDIDVELTEVDRKRLTFTTRVVSGDKVVSEGTHQRFVVGEPKD